MSTATGISGGAAHTLPSLFFRDEGSGLHITLANATLLPEETVDEKLCHVITGDNSQGKVTLWITQKDLLLKQTRKAHAANSNTENASTPEQVDLETMRKLLKTMGQDSTPEAVSKMTKQMDTLKQQAATMQITVTETFDRITTNELMIIEDFEVTIPVTAKPSIGSEPQ